MMQKGQSATEYLVTYGWAILIVIVVVASLWTMGVFPSSNETSLPSKVTCKNWCSTESMNFTSFGSSGSCTCETCQTNYDGNNTFLICTEKVFKMELVKE